MATGAAGRDRYRWLVLLVAAAMLVGWLVTGGGQDSDPGASTATEAPSSSSPTQELTEPSSEPTSDLPTIELADLPPEAAQTVELIDRGGPFPEPDHDGGVFENREDLLPDQPDGYYREYTVPTPGSQDRGARRIIAGDGGELYWTGDHYRSFALIVRPG
jgi:ribonuclease T1